jgi:hypothetical protein
MTGEHRRRVAQLRPISAIGIFEQFFEWAEESPDEVLAVQQAEADRGLKELLRQERDLGRSVRTAGRYRRSWVGAGGGAALMCD